MINNLNFNDYLYRLRWSHELQTELGGGIVYNQVPHQVDVVRMLGGGQVSSVRTAMWAHDTERRTEGSHLTFLQFEDGSAASMTFSGYDFFDTDEFNFWVGELGEEKDADRHGSARRMLAGLKGAKAENELKLSRSFGGAGHAGMQALSRGKPTHHSHFGFLLASCTLGDVRPSNDGVLIYSSEGCRHVPVPPPRAFPEKSGVFDEMHEAISGIRPLHHDGEWGRATHEVLEAMRISAHEKREVFLSRQVPFGARSA
jgi:phthalate 4,5-cis-dihydrodiol dehydrogenase